MPRSAPNAKTRALRALAEGVRPTIEVLADASGRSPRQLRIQAEREGWRLQYGLREDWSARLRGMIAPLAEQMEAVIRRAFAEDGRIDKSEIDSLVSVMRGLEKLGEFMRQDEAANENNKDEELAAILERVNQRILLLAREIAADMVRETKELGAEADRLPRGGAAQG